MRCPEEVEGMSRGVVIRGSRVSVILLVVGMFACRQAGDGSRDDQDHQAPDLPVDSCRQLSEDECKAADNCWSLEGWPIPDACIVAQDTPGAPLARFVACVSGHIVCGAAFTWAAPPTDPTEMWLFPNTCIPDGWVDPEGPGCIPDCPHDQCDECCASEDHVCDPDGRCCLPDCAGKECGDDGCGGECCGGEPVGPEGPWCCGGIAGTICSEHCPGWGSEPPTCIPPVECLQPCIEECPEGWTCKMAESFGTDVGFYCFPKPLGPPCKPCEADSDCPGGVLWEVDRCAAVLGEVPTCVSACSSIPKLPCPPWHSCVSAETVDGEVLDVCVPDPGQCECLPEPETCDGEDNDCDGETDEDCPSR